MKKIFTFIILFTVLQTHAQFSRKFCRNPYNGLVFVYDLYDGNFKVGNVIEMNRSSKEIEAHYLPNLSPTDNSVSKRIWDNARNYNIFLISSGAYSQNFDGVDVPVGLCVHYGQTLNDNVEKDMDALVIIEKGGGIRVSDLDEKNLSVRMTDGQYEQLNVRNPFDLEDFITWAKDNEATVFQTHLLIYKNTLRIYKNTLRVSITAQQASRRKVILLLKDRLGILYHALVYIKSANYGFFNLSDKLLQMYNDAGYNVIACFNLDTGGANYLNSGINDCENKLILGTSSLQSTSNLIFWDLKQ